MRGSGDIFTVAHARLDRPLNTVSSSHDDSDSIFIFLLFRKLHTSSCPSFPRSQSVVRSSILNTSTEGRIVQFIFVLTGPVEARPGGMRSDLVGSSLINSSILNHHMHHRSTPVLGIRLVTSLDMIFDIAGLHSYTV